MNQTHVFRYETPAAEILKQIQNDPRPVVFLAGPTVRGNQPHLTSWRFEAIQEFEKYKFHGYLIVPEFTSKTESDKSKEWIPHWEFSGLLNAHARMFWIPRTRELIGLTTNMEFGYWQGREPQSIVYGRPADAYRIAYLDIMWKAVAAETNTYVPVIYNNLKETIVATIALASINYEIPKWPPIQMIAESQEHLVGKA